MTDTSWWTESRDVGMVLNAVSSSVGVAAAEGALMNSGIRTLGQLAAESDEELRAIPGLRLGPVTMEAIHKVQDLWRAKQGAAPEVMQVEPSDAQRAFTAGLAPRTEFPEPSPLAAPGAAARRARHRPAGREIPGHGKAPGT